MTTVRDETARAEATSSLVHNDRIGGRGRSRQSVTEAAAEGDRCRYDTGAARVVAVSLLSGL